MFVELAPLVEQIGEIVVTIRKGHNGVMKVIVAPGPQTTNNIALRRPMALAADPGSLDDGFAEAIKSYCVAHTSLKEQVDKTVLLLETDKAAEGTKTVKAAQARVAGAAKATMSATDPDDDDEDDDPQNGALPAATSRPPAAEPSAGRSLEELLGL